MVVSGAGRGPSFKLLARPALHHATSPAHHAQPSLQVWLGSFPIVINFWAAVSITVYYAATLGLM